MPCLSLLIAITTRMDASSPTDAYRHPARPTTTDTASTSPLFRLPTFPPCPLFQNPHDVALDVAVESLPLLRRPAVSFTRYHHVSECGAQTGLTTTPATPTPTRPDRTRQGQDRANTKHPSSPCSTSNLELHPRNRQHQSASPPRRFRVPSCLCTSVPRSPACPCAPSRVLSVPSCHRIASIQP
jgi:hypothetical protein